MPVNERLHGELGEALQAVLRRELAGFDAADFPLKDHTRRVA